VERVILSNKSYFNFSLRFEEGDLPKILFCQNCPFSQNACSILDSSVANRIVGRIDLNDSRVAELSGQNLKPTCGDISDLLK